MSKEVTEAGLMGLNERIVRLEERMVKSEGGQRTF